MHEIVRGMNGDATTQPGASGQGSGRFRQQAEAHRRKVIHNEIANTVTHGVGLLLSVAGLVVLLMMSVTRGGPLAITSFAIYGASMILMFGISTAYHSVKKGKWKRRLRTLDHCAIYVFIAGSYTPFTLVAMSGGWGWSLFGVAWGIAILGVLLKVLVSSRPSGLSTGIYIMMGWMSAVAVVPLYHALGFGGIMLLLGGGLAYTVGVFFFHRDHRHLHHAVWHLFVIAGCALHFGAMVFYVV